MSELYGRRATCFAGYAVLIIFQVPVSVTQNIQTIMVRRFLGADAAADPSAIAGRDV